MTEILDKLKRRYFEVFGDLEKEIQFLRKANGVLIGFLFFMFGAVVLLGMKPPVVIRVSEVQGAEAIQDLAKHNTPTSFEILNFSKRFASCYTAFNSYTLTRDMSEAFNFMTAKLQKDAKRSLVESGLLEKLKDAGVDSQIEFKEAKLDRDSSEASVVTLVGVRKISKYQEPDFHQEILFRAEVVLKKVRRSMSVPEGLLIEAYKEIILNDVTRKETRKQ